MPALTFQKRFVGPIKRGEKKQTIRLPRLKNKIKKGQILYLYNGMRTKQCNLITKAWCKSIRKLRFLHNGGITLDGQLLSGFEMEELATNDGFENMEKMREWFDNKYHDKYHGGMYDEEFDLIIWETDAAKMGPSTNG